MHDGAEGCMHDQGTFNLIVNYNVYFVLDFILKYKQFYDVTKYYFWLIKNLTFLIISSVLKNFQELSYEFKVFKDFTRKNHLFMLSRMGDYLSYALVLHQFKFWRKYTNP